jgi:DNA-directed RNA polymerase subunit F
MILDRTPINMNEVNEIVNDIEDSPRKEEIELYLKKFMKTKPNQAKKIKEEIEALDSIKIKRDHIVKIVDLLPADSSDLNKIFTDVSLNEEEINKILEIIKNSK